jgi:hypothetical protein
MLWLLYGLENPGTTGTAAQQADLTNVIVTDL